jgi:murein DD-endopeptidase MepM/ murein hydrolase activator NlpD
MKLLLTLATAVTVMVAAAAPVLAGERPVALKDVKRADGGFDVWAESTGAGPTTIDFELTTLTNASPSVYKRQLVVPAGERVLVARVYASNRRQAWNYRHRHWYQVGDRDAQPDDTVYRLPYRSNAVYRVMQAYNGTYSHQGKQAIDFEMPVGTPVLAARGGVVVATEDQNTEGGPSQAMRDKANYVLIAHDDGTVAGYYHLAHRGVKVAVGQRVKTGAVIGLSGNTGFSSAPHLHFEVRVPESGKGVRTIPTAFETEDSDDEGEWLKQGQRYTAP